MLSILPFFVSVSARSALYAAECNTFYKALLDKRINHDDRKNTECCDCHSNGNRRNVAEALIGLASDVTCVLCQSIDVLHQTVQKVLNAEQVRALYQVDITVVPVPENSATVAMIGLESGITMRESVVISPAPSMKAASTISSGTLLTK